MHQINVGENIMERNREIAAENREMLRSSKVTSVNIMSAPGAGKTSLLVSSLPQLMKKRRVAVIEGDVQTTRDADRVSRTGVEVFQIETGGACHLDASMVHRALHQIDLDNIDLLLIENVGNLVCPAEFELGVDARVMLLSVTEGDDKPKKYPLMFLESSMLILNKIDIIEYVDFDMERAGNEAREINPRIEIMKLSCRTGEGMEDWIGWVDKLCDKGGK
jgi:hydrogenase nickel incorporation protein HypB